MDPFDLQPRRRRISANRPRSFWRGLLSGIGAFVIVVILTVGGGLITYSAIAAGLPAPEDLTSRASVFQSTRILDREGNLLNETFDPNEGRRIIVPLDQISPYLREATIATEDANFYRHRGVDPIAIVRALYYAMREGDVVSGGSTIPQQLVKMVLLTPERSLTREVKEAILSEEISRRYAKDQILALYLNELFYGNFAYGADAAAATYFGKDVADLTLAEAALLAGLPQLPAYYDPYTQPDRAKKRQGIVLGLMVEAGYISPAEADAAWQEPLVYAPLSFDMVAPHFTLYVRQELETYFGPEALYQTGLEVTTSLDPALQDLAQQIVHDQVAQLASHNVSNGALVAMHPQTGEILAFVGSADFDNVEIDGQVNMALAPCQPGSSIKPFVYLAAFEQLEKPAAERWTPGTLIADIETQFPDGANPPYIPTNYDNREHGMVTVRTALANSFNIPAVQTLQVVALQDFLELMRRTGVTTLTRPDYGLSLALGGGEIPLLELTGGYAMLANGGRQVSPAAILKITDSQGSVICEIGTATPCQPTVAAGGDQIVDPANAFLIGDILADNVARTPSFGPNSVLRLDRPASVKTGTTNDFRDNLTVGYTPQLVTGVWIGNADNSEMHDISGVSGAGPIWNQFMLQALANQPVQEFTPPPGVQIYSVCADTGTLPSPACPETRQHWFKTDQPPLPPEKDLYQIVRLDRSSGRLANEFTPAEAIEEKVFKIYPDQHRQWAEAHGIPQPPADETDVFTFAPELFIRQPVEGEIVNGLVTVYGTANVPAFQSYELQYGVSHDPGAFSPPVSGPFGAPVIDSILGQWNTEGLGDGPHTIRILVRDTFGTEYETRVRVFVVHPTATPLPTATWTPLPPTPEPATPVPDTPTALPPAPTAIPTQAPVEPVEPPPTTVPQEPTATLPPADTPTPVEVAPPTPTVPVASPTVEQPPESTPVEGSPQIPPDTPTPTIPVEQPVEQPPVAEPTLEFTPTWTPIPAQQ